MITQPPSSRQIQFLFTIALASLLVLGTARLVLDNLKKSQSSFLQLLLGNAHQVLRLPVNISNEDVIDDGCNVFEGNWVWDNTTYPFYTEDRCPFLVKQVTCQRNGRRDSLYQNWRWQPNYCNLPRFNALKLLEVLRDKRLMFVGDSIQRGMFESMVCLVQSVLPDGEKSLKRIPPRKIFTAKEYNASIEYFWAPFIVDSTSDNATNHTVLKRLVKLDSIAKHGKQWEGVDIFVFESYIWWMYKPLINATFGSPHNVQEYKVATAYRLALETWANWIETRVNPHNQKVYFMSMSPTHLWSWEWKHGSEGNCFNESHPIHGSYWGTGSNLEIMEIVRDVLEQLKIDVTLLNITQLSEFRKDGHTSVYGERRGKLLTREQRSDPNNFADCIHWCLPGVPDTWNEILYAHILKNYQSKSNKLGPSS
ncbi:Protein trichome birefringence-like [Actinidia chinensis var. chinensis]|uniref:Protein trichome birefringence-like n=1 Tax=Actinidia chinensis var. chinensis TaxID=1590841 RepID=A0A2R6QX81_ACTCC|nr:Protein trichome birefringence-like [Actinidia chinensis var. chinensis]